MKKKKAIQSVEIITESPPEGSNVIQLPFNWKQRNYQEKVWKYFTEQDGKRALTFWHRRAGKDLTAINMVAVKAFQRIGMYLHVFPHYSQGRKVIWEGRDKQGRSFLDSFPKDLIANRVEDEMKIEFVNGSIYRVVGANNIDSFRGLNTIGVVMSEYAFMNPEAWQVLRPILDENKGWAWFVTTPNGKNHAYKLAQTANQNSKWFCEILTINDTGVLPPSVIDEAIAEGMDPVTARQEYLCSFEENTMGSYYGELMRAAEEDGRIKDFSYESRRVVYTSWDLGVNDMTVIWFWQKNDRKFELIDYYENKDLGLDHYINLIHSKPYVYAQHFAPHDVEARDGGTATSRLEIARRLGVKFEVAPRMRIEDGIEASRSILPQCVFHATKCEKGIAALQAYRKEYDKNRLVYLNVPEHDWASDPADAFRIGAIMIREATNHLDKPMFAYADHEYDPFANYT